MGFPYPDGPLPGNASWVLRDGTGWVVTGETAISPIDTDNQDSRDMAPLTLTAPFSVEVDFQISAVSGDATGLQLGVSDAARTIGMYFDIESGSDTPYDPTDCTVTVGDYSGGSDAVAIVLPAGVPHTARLQFDGANIKFYLDGVLQVTHLAIAMDPSQMAIIDFNNTGTGATAGRWQSTRIQFLP